MIDGLAVVDKPAGWTSHDAVARCRKVFGQKRVGHAGTLDPDATGVLLVGLGRVTRLLRFLTPLEKSYVGEVVLGTATSTLDASGTVTGEWDMGAVTLEEARAATRAFLGDIDQVPPMVSAIQIDGQRLHELARQGIEVERPARRVTVGRFDVEPTADPAVLRIEVDCSSGTYIRSLAADLGTALGGGAHLRNLRRTRIGSFGEADATPLDDLTDSDFLRPTEALRHLGALEVAAEAASEISYGRKLSADLASGAGSGPWRLVDATGDLLAVYEPGEDGRIVPAVVLTPR